MKIVVKKVGQMPEIKEVENELHVLQDIVGGWIECFRMGLGNMVCVCNDDGKYLCLHVNFVHNFDPICGDVFFCGTEHEDFTSLNDQQINFIMEIFSGI